MTRTARFITAATSLGLKQYELADLLGLGNTTYVSRIMTGKQTPSEPLVRLIEELAKKEQNA